MVDKVFRSCSLMSNNMKNLHALATSNNLRDKMTYMLFITLLDIFFGKHEGTIVLDNTVETDYNDALIRDNWIPLKYYYGLSDKIKSNQKVVRQVIKHMIDFFNGKYEFEDKIEFILHRKTIREGESFKSISYTLIKL